MTDSIITCVRGKRFATFQDLAREVTGFPGGYGMFSPTQPAVIIWHAVSQQGIAALGGLIGAGKVFMHVAPKISYRADLEYPEFPLCLDMEKDGAGPEIKWLPVVFTATPATPVVDGHAA